MQAKLILQYKVKTGLNLIVIIMYCIAEWPVICKKKKKITIEAVILKEKLRFLRYWMLQHC